MQAGALSAAVKMKSVLVALSMISSAVAGVACVNAAHPSRRLGKYLCTLAVRPGTRLRGLELARPRMDKRDVDTFSRGRDVDKLPKDQAVYCQHVGALAELVNEEDVA